MQHVPTNFPKAFILKYIVEKTKKYDDVKWISSQQGCCPLQCTGRNWNSLVGNRCKKYSISIRKQFLALLTKCWWNFLCNYTTNLVTTRDVQVHFFRELDHSRSLPKKSEPRSLTLMNFLFSKIWAKFTHDHSHSRGRSQNFLDEQTVLINLNKIRS